MNAFQCFPSRALILLLALLAGNVFTAQAQATFAVELPPEGVASVADADGRMTPEVLMQHLREEVQLVHRGEAPLRVWVLAWTLQDGEVVDGRPLGEPQEFSPGQKALGSLVSEEHLVGFLEATGLTLSDNFVAGEEAFSAARGLSLSDTSTFTGEALQQAMSAVRLPASFRESLSVTAEEVAVVLFLAPFGPRMQDFTYRPAAFAVGSP